MSEQQTEGQEQTTEQGGSQEQTFPLKLVKVGTGATHYVDGGSRVDLIRDEATGEPEQEYRLVTTIDGQDVTLQSFSASRLDTRAANLKAAQQPQQQPQQV